MYRYSLSNPEEAKQITNILDSLGIHIEYDIFGILYFLVESKTADQALHQKKLYHQPRHRNPNMDELVRVRIQTLYESGKSVREIKKLTGYSVGAVHKAIHSKN